MLQRGVALVALLALSPAHATLIEHSSAPTNTNVRGDVYEDLGGGISHTIVEEFLFGDAVPDARYRHLWRLQTRIQARGDNQQATGRLIEWVEFCLSERFIGSLTDSSLQVPWQGGTLNGWLGVPFGNGADARTSTSVPEPGTLSLLGAGLLGAWAARRRRRDTAT